VLLDNCEHLLAACGELADALLRHCPGVTLLTTSREPLAILGETTYRIPPLSLPRMVDGSDNSRRSINHQPSTINESEALRLFVDRAVAAQPSFVLTDENAGGIARICRYLEGIPLAIEMAAAR